MRFGIEPWNAARASRIMSETINVQLIKPFDRGVGNRYLSYVPFWA